MDENEKKPRVFPRGLYIAGIFVAIAIPIALIFPELLVDPCTEGLNEIYIIAEEDATYSERLEEKYLEYFERCYKNYTLEQQIEINQKISEIIKNKRMENNA